MLKDKEVEKRLNYYLNIESKYKEKTNQSAKPKDFKGFLKNSNEYIREILKKGLPAKDQKVISQQLIAAGVTIKPEEYVASRLFFAVVIGWAFQVFFNVGVFFIFGAVLGFYAPKMWVASRRTSRVDKFNDGLADMITTIIGALKAGYSFPQALKTVADESQSPIKEEIEELNKELNYGISMEDALNNLKARMPSIDLELMIHAVLIQRQIGGNLSIILETIVNTIRERKKLQRHVKTLTAQGRLSGKIVAALPFVITLIMYVSSREMLVGFATNKYGQIAIAIGLFMCILGFVTMSKITKIEV
jgi:tight adherence protein B